MPNKKKNRKRSRQTEYVESLLYSSNSDSASLSGHNIAQGGGTDTGDGNYSDDVENSSPASLDPQSAEYKLNEVWHISL